MVGDDQTPPPDGPQRVDPPAFFPIGFASAAIVNVFQTSAPVAASSATRLPRNVQHSYVGLPPCASSLDATGTYRRPSCSVGVPVMFALRCSSIARVQSCSPVAASSAYAVARPSPKYAANLPAAPGRGPMTIPVRTAAFAWYVQTMQPLLASSA